MLKKQYRNSEKKTLLKTNPESLEKLYDKYALEYSRLLKSGSRSLLANYYIEMPSMLKQIGNIKGIKILDLGCGTGIHIKEYEKRGAQCFGVDLSSAMLKIATRKTKSAKLKKANMTEGLPFKKGFFDIVTMSLVIDHVQNIGGVLDEIKRVLKKNGRVLISDRSEIMLLNNKKEYDYKMQTEFILGMKYVSYRRSIHTVVSILYDHGFVIRDILPALPRKSLKNISRKAYEFYSKFPKFFIYDAVKR